MASPRAYAESVTEEKVTFCRICEPLCGLVATVDDGVVTKLRPDKDHPLTKGFACPKGIAMTEIQNDPDRVLYPLRRRADGDGFERVSWAMALGEIGARLRAVRDRDGTGAIGCYLGNPAAFSYSHLIWFKGFIDALETRHFYSASSQDTSSRFVASKLLFGSPLTIPVPDLLHTDFLLMVGANPVVSHGSMVQSGNIREDLNEIVARGGRVVVVDPRRTETARMFEHVGVIPGADAWFLLSLLHVILDEGLADVEVMRDQCTGESGLRALVERFSPEDTADRSGIDAKTIRALARDLAVADSAAVYGRVGACTGPNGTLVNFLLDAINAVTGNLDRRGGAVFPTPPIDTYGPAIKRGMDSYDTYRSRIGDYPEVLGSMPAGVLPDEILTPGPGRLRALIVTCGNPVLSCPGGERLTEALQDLDLLVSLDIYINESNRHADYILPATTFLEREDVTAALLPYQLRPFIQWTDPVVAPRGQARQEWEIFNDISAELGIAPFSVKEMRRFPRLSRRLLTPKLMYDVLLRSGPVGDRFGLRRKGWNLKRIAKHPHGVEFDYGVPTGVLQSRITHTDRKVHLADPAIVAEVGRMEDAAQTDAEFPLRMFGRRDLRSINSWMHNSQKLQRANKGPTLLVHPDDAGEHGFDDGGAARLTSRGGSVDVLVELSDDVQPGAVCLPHGWGHARGGWQQANALGGPNANALTRTGVGTVEALAGMTILNGLPVRLGPV